ncbi:MAG: cache domain-containing protein [Pseudomonadota bacterium]
MHRRMILISLVVSLALIFPAMNCLAEISADDLAKESEARAVATEKDPLTTDLIMKKVDEACALLAQKGEAAFPAFQGKDSDFIFAGTYIWIHDQKGIMRMHPIKNKLNGKVLINLADSNGKLFFAVMNEVAEQKGSGWVDYMWPKPGDKKPFPKISYVKQVQFGDETFVVGAGTYDEAVIAKIKGQ